MAIRLATIVPLIKDKLGLLNSSRNYRTIVIGRGSLILKLLDWIILILFGAKLGIDHLKFASSKGSQPIYAPGLPSRQPATSSKMMDMFTVASWI